MNILEPLSQVISDIEYFKNKIANTDNEQAKLKYQQKIDYLEDIKASYNEKGIIG